MARENNTGRDFTEYLDRLLKGEELTGELPGVYREDPEFHSALHFAGRMKSLRAEPSAEFRDSLKERLLQKMAELEAARQKLTFWQSAVARFESLFPPALQRFALPAAALVLIIVISIAVMSRTGVFPPNVSDLRVEFPAAAPAIRPSFEIAAAIPVLPAKPKVQQLNRPDITTESLTALGVRLGLTDKATATSSGVITLSDRTGAILKGYPDTGVIEYAASVISNATPLLPDETQAKEIAKNYLAQLLPAPYGVLVMSDIRVEGLGSEAPYVSVRLAEVINGIPTAGPASASEVRIGNLGTVTGFTVWERDIAGSVDIELKDPSLLNAELTNGRGYYVIPPGTRKVSIRKISLAYWLDTSAVKQDYLLPVYELSGDCLDEAGNFLGNFNGWVDAAK